MELGMSEWHWMLFFGVIAFAALTAYIATGDDE